MKIYGDLQSGNCLKVKYTADHLGMAYDWVDIDITAGHSKAADFLAVNPFGQVPAIELDDNRTLGQSNAIIRYLAQDTSLLPDDHYLQAKVDEWLFWEQYSHEPYIAVCRFHMVYLKKSKETREPWRVERGEIALDILESHLKNKEWLAGDRFTIADISLVAYSRLADEGGFELSARPNLANWITRCEYTLSL